MSARHLCSSTRMRGIFSRLPHRPVSTRESLFARPLAKDMAVTSSDNFVLAFTTAAPLGLSHADQTERASLPRPVQVSTKLAVSDNGLAPSLASDNHSLLLLMHGIEKTLVESRGKSNDAKDEKIVSLDKI